MTATEFKTRRFRCNKCGYEHVEVDNIIHSINPRITVHLGDNTTGERCFNCIVEFVKTIAGTFEEVK